MDPKSNHHKLRTLCTIDTSDIDLNDTRHPRPRNKKSHLGLHLRAQSKCTPKATTPLSLKHQSQSRKQTKSQPKKLGKTMGRERLKTQYSQSQWMKSMHGNKKEETIKSNMKRNVIYPFSEQYRTDAYEIIESLPTTLNEKVFLVRRDGILYLLRKTKDKNLKKEYMLEEAMKLRVPHIKSKNLVKLHRSYRDRVWSYLVYEYAGESLCWHNGLHRQVINKVMKDEGAVLIYLVKEMSRGIHQLASKGYAHGNLTLEAVHMRIQESEKDVRVEGSIKIGSLGHCLDIKEKQKFLLLPHSIYTPPEIINYMIFEQKGKFDRTLIEYITIENHPWYIDVWALAIIILELIAAEPINLQKSVSPHSKDILLMDDEIGLADILLAQKNLLLQTEEQLESIRFLPSLHSLLIRMLSINPLDRPSPKQIIRELS